MRAKQHVAHANPAELYSIDGSNELKVRQALEQKRKSGSGMRRSRLRLSL